MNTTPNSTDILQTLQVFHQGRPFEVRCFPNNPQFKSASGVYTDAEVAVGLVVRAAEELLEF